MTDVYNEAQQVEQIKKWFKEYGTAVIVGVLIALLLGYGWRYWQRHQEVQLTHASLRYEQLLTNVVNGNSSAVEIQADRLMERYRHTPYAQLAALQLARQYVYQNKLDAAVEQLNWVMRRGDSPALCEVARIRLARIYLAQNQLDKGLELLNKSDDAAYTAASLEAKGDILLAQHKPDEARAAYEQALHAFPGLEAMQPILQMKIDDLAGNDEDNKTGASA